MPLPRRVGYRATLEAAGLPATREFEAHGPFSIDGGDEATVQLLSLRRLPTAIFAECDEMAFGVLRALRRVGLRVPADVSVIGFDDHPMAPFFELTTISQDVRDQGRRIAEHLVDAVARSGEAPPVELHASTRLVVRGTTAVVSRDRTATPALVGAMPAVTAGDLSQLHPRYRVAQDKHEGGKTDKRPHIPVRALDGAQPDVSRCAARWHLTILAFRRGGVP